MHYERYLLLMIASNSEAKIGVILNESNIDQIEAEIKC